jgi:tripartite-type tricarboxylate transporter receptor subunit TctC
LAEQGLNFEAGLWFAFLAPAGVPKDILNLLHGEVIEVMKGPEALRLVEVNGAVLVGNTPEEFA